MAGPMSAPNGDRGLIRGDKHERFVEVKYVDEEGKERIKYVPARLHAAARGRLYTGKTERKNK
jgi:hypothetical protein